MFLQLFSAIVGGSIWLSLQPSIKPSARLAYAFLSDMAVTITTFVVVVMVVDNLRSWRRYRISISEMGTGVGFTRPNLFPSALSETAMLIGILAACGSFWLYNPFLLIPN
jgi:hypothetical protein